MAKLYGQARAVVLESAGTTLVASGSVSGSAVSHGYKTLVGAFYSNASAAVGAASGLKIMQSADYGANWDVVSASYPVTASAASTFSIAVGGNAVKVQLWNGAGAASLMRYTFYLLPV